jgi:hypothetical protein
MRQLVGVQNRPDGDDELDRRELLEQMKEGEPQ